VAHTLTNVGAHQRLTSCSYSASAMQSAVIATGILSVWLSVCPTRSSIVFTRMKIRSCSLQPLVG